MRMIAQLIISFIFLLQNPKTQDLGPVQLDWQVHYRAKGDETSPYLALTAMIFRYSYQSSVKGRNLSLSFKFEVDVDRNKSWKKLYRIRTKEAQDHLLHHEQGHVNINYLQMREAEKLLTSRRYSVSTHREEIKKVADKVIRDFDEMQKLYDLETKHGMDRNAQAKWDLFIGNALKEVMQTP
ncbi:MAG: DUF922 domain-containing protein [Chitinophagaceae bacterium]|nr:MAG: DUF922 domain-containing protein [Chitinophagaceae bacterium]